MEPHSVVVDANLLLLLVVGLWNPRAIANQKRLSALTYDDFDLLRTFLGTFRKVVTTSYVLAEVSNLAGSASGLSRIAIFGQLAGTIETLDERSLPAAELCTQPEFLAFGITDAALCRLCRTMLLVTEDGRLAHHLHLRGFNALSLVHLRNLRESAQNV
jgi:rRNA-processing protein FCF1